MRADDLFVSEEPLVRVFLLQELACEHGESRDLAMAFSEEHQTLHAVGSATGALSTFGCSTVRSSPVVRRCSLTASRCALETGPTIVLPSCISTARTSSTSKESRRIGLCVVRITWPR